MRRMPRDFLRRVKPDFLAPSSRVLIGSQNITFEQVVEGDPTAGLDDEDAVSALEPDRRPIRYYESQKILGRLYRAIDDKKFLADMQAETQRQLIADTVSTNPNMSVMEQIWDFVQRKTLLVQWKQHEHFARELRDTYYDNLHESAWVFSPNRGQPLTELEVFTGIILGKEGGIQNKRLRESSMDLREKFARDCQFVIEMVGFARLRRRPAYTTRFQLANLCTDCQRRPGRGQCSCGC